MPQYPGRRTPPVFPESITLSDDGGPPTAAAFNPGLQGAFDAAVYLKALADGNACVPVVMEFLASDTFQIPANALPWGFFDGCGGGGRGGAGVASPVKLSANSGGGGGGGALRHFGLVGWVPGEFYNAEIGEGGFNDVSDFFGLYGYGRDTKVTRASNNEVVVLCKGAAPGQRGNTVVGRLAAPSGGGFRNQFWLARGGRSVRFTDQILNVDLACERTFYATSQLDLAPQTGGLGVTAHWPIEVDGQATFGCNGGSCPAFDGGSGGVPGLCTGEANDRWYGGGSGGGGGAGPWGNGARGGDGSDAVTTGASAPPQRGEDAPPNSGAGGGGGGSAGSSPNATQGAVGGFGGSGRLYLVYFIPTRLP